ncbi:hypothetical protein HHK36_013644 [Tetracentron sinense]|uniref:Uncharacterized protein n=1 Tax=Tetracentron sinense TaxID=13715 RepID=A0A834Z6N1_TETSI|nr:hypothetical protein HHK36_013644 [Tetracentron sinense]
MADLDHFCMIFIRRFSSVDASLNKEPSIQSMVSPSIEDRSPISSKERTVPKSIAQDISIVVGFLHTLNNRSSQRRSFKDIPCGTREDADVLLKDVDDKNVSSL